MCRLRSEGRSKALAQTLQGKRDLDLLVDLTEAANIGGEMEHSSDSPSELFGCGKTKETKNQASTGVCSIMRFNSFSLKDYYSFQFFPFLSYLYPLVMLVELLN